MSSTDFDQVEHVEDCIPCIDTLAESEQSGNYRNGLEVMRAAGVSPQDVINFMANHVSLTTAQAEAVVRWIANALGNESTE